MIASKTDIQVPNSSRSSRYGSPTGKPLVGLCRAADRRLKNAREVSSRTWRHGRSFILIQTQDISLSILGNMPSLAQTLYLAAFPIIAVAVLWTPLSQNLQIPWSFSTNDPQVRLSQGLVVGTVLDNKFPAPIEAFMGLPYSQPPTEDRRFRRAVPLPASNDTFKAQSYGPMYVCNVLSYSAYWFGYRCPGKQLLPGNAADNSEDCMTVNIFRQRPTGDEKKVPVAVYIHGGAFNRGSCRP